MISLKSDKMAEEQEETATIATRPSKAGSTHLHPFPMVHIVKPKCALNKDRIYYDEVADLRAEMKSRLYAIDASEKFEHDMKRTTDDFWRMELDGIAQIGDDNRKHMVNVIKVYLGQTEGARAALKPLLKHLEKDEV